MLYLEHTKISFKKGCPVISFQDKMGQNLSVRKAGLKGINRLLNYVLDLELLIVRLAGFIPCYFIRRLVYLGAGVKIGKNAHLHMGTQFFYPANVEIGEGTIVGQNAFLDGRDQLKIGKYVDIASEVMIYNSKHDINAEDFQAVSYSVKIGDYAFIGPRAIIMPGVKIGYGAIVAAGAVVTHDVDDFVIAGGVPARVIGERKLKNLHYKLGRARLFQ